MLVVWANGYYAGELWRALLTSLARAAVASPRANLRLPNTTHVIVTGQCSRQITCQMALLLRAFS